MRTRKARRIRRLSLIRSRVRGHRPALVSTSGAITIYACHHCPMIFEVWDNPDHAAGQMLHQPCQHVKLSWWRKFLLAVIPVD